METPGPAGRRAQSRAALRVAADVPARHALLSARAVALDDRDRGPGIPLRLDERLHRNRLEPDAVDLSERRANAVKEAVINEFKFDPNKFNVEGFGWDRPADPSDPENNALNRRVEVQWFTVE